MDWARFARGAQRLAGIVGRRGTRSRQAVRLDWRLATVGPDGVERDVRTFRNLVVNDGLDGAKSRLFEAATAINVFDYVAIGSDATAEDAADSALGSELARAQATYSDAGTAACLLEVTFPAGTGTGNVNEVGLLDAAAAGVMYSRHALSSTYPKAAGDALKVSIAITLTNA